MLQRGIVLMALAVLTLSCKKEKAEEPEYNPVIDPAHFVSAITNPLFPLAPGQIFVYVSGSDSNEVEVTDQTHEVMGVNCVVVRDHMWSDRDLVEETYDWYAQDSDSNVWYFGEISLEYENGVVVSTEGSWEAGEDEARPGIIMKAHPQVGDSYRQEYLEDEAEDMADVVSLTESVTVPFGTYTNCLKTREWTPLEPGVQEFKSYAAGVGQIKVEEGSEVFVLVAIR